MEERRKYLVHRIVELWVTVEAASVEEALSLTEDKHDNEFDHSDSCDEAELYQGSSDT